MIREHHSTFQIKLGKSENIQTKLPFFVGTQKRYLVSDYFSFLYLGVHVKLFLKDLIVPISSCAILSFFQSNVAASNAKLSLFYDWLFFEPDKDSIMNIGKYDLALIS